MSDMMCPYCLKTVQGDVCVHCGHDVHYAGRPNHLPVGYTLMGLRPYVLGAAIGQGGFGITYIALDMETGHRVAVKEYFPTHCCGRSDLTNVYPNLDQEVTFAKGKERFLDEARMLKSLSDLDSVVNVLDFFEANNSAYLVMEYLDGLSLKDQVEKNGKLLAQQFIAQMKPLMADMEMMHRRGVVHRDIAPDNIILLPDGRLKLIDFGAARSYVGDKSMTVVVKKGFAPVEQYMRKGSNASTDVYALAATIYYCITGIIPPDSAERQYGEAELLAPTALGVELSQAQELGLEKALAIQPKDRIQSVSEFMEALKHLPKSMLMKQEEERRQQEILRKKQEEERRRQEMLLKKQEEERKRQEKIQKKREEERLRQEMLRKKQEEKRFQQEELRKKQEEKRLQQEELRKRQKEKRLQQEELRKKQEEERRQRVKQKKEQAVHSEEPVKTNSGKSGKRYLLIAAALAVVLAGALLIPRFLSMGDTSLSVQETEVPVTDAAAPEESQPVQELSAEDRQYNEAVDFFNNGEYGEAAIAFGKLGDYRDAKEISRQIWDAIADRKTIAAGHGFTAAIRENGAVVACGQYAPDASDLNDIVSLAASTDGWNLWGLKADGKVINLKSRTEYAWTDIVAIEHIKYSPEYQRTGLCALRADGRVFFEPDWDIAESETYKEKLEQLQDVVSIKSGYFVQLADNTVMLNFEINEQQDIVTASTTRFGVAVLKRDGTVNFIPENLGLLHNETLTAHEKIAEKMESDIAGWQDVVSICGDGLETVLGIKSDGTVVGTGDTSGANPLIVDKWTDVVAVTASDCHSVGLQSDGTLVTSGNSGLQERRTYGMDNIRLPANRDTLLAAIELKHITSEDVSKMTPSGLSAEATAYNEAVDFFENKEYGKAAIAFAKLGDYRDAKEISSKIWSAITDQDIIHAGYGYAAAVRDDGAVMTAGEAKFDDSKVHDWKDIVAVEPVMGELAGLKSDGSVVGTGSWIESNFDLWNNLVSIQEEHGLCSDGTFATSVQEIRDCYSWLFDAEDIISVQCANFASGDGAILKADGTVEGWKESSNGKSLVPIEEVSEWKDIISIEYSSAGNLFGVSADGKVYSARTSRAAGTYQTDDWTDIVSITNCGSHVLGLKSDGTVVAAGQTPGRHYDEEDWSDIAAIYLTADHTIGLKSDGTVVTTGIEDAVTKGMKEWTNIKIPVRRDDLQTAIQLDYITE